MPTHIAASFSPRSLPTLLSISLCIPLHSGLPVVLVNTDVSLCLQSKVAAWRNFIFYESGTSPRCSLHQRVWPGLQTVPQARPSDTTFPLPNLLNQQYWLSALAS